MGILRLFIERLIRGQKFNPVRPQWKCGNLVRLPGKCWNLVRSKAKCRNLVRLPGKCRNPVRTESYCSKPHRILILIDIPWFKLVSECFQIAKQWMFWILKNKKQKWRRPQHIFSSFWCFSFQTRNIFFHVEIQWKSSLNPRVSMKIKFDAVWEHSLAVWTGFLHFFQPLTGLEVSPRQNFQLFQSKSRKNSQRIFKRKFLRNLLESWRKI